MVTCRALCASWPTRPMGESPAKSKAGVGAGELKLVLEKSETPGALYTSPAGGI
jgi:hypothetical protein